MTKKERIKRRVAKIIKALETMQNVLTFDTETTALNNHIIYVDGLPISIDTTIDNPEIIELAFMLFDKKGKFSFYEDVCKPKNTIVSPMPAAITGYSNHSLKDAKEFDKVEAVKKFIAAIKKEPFIIAHNMPFDKQMVALHGINLEKRLIDTVRVAKHSYKDGLKNLDGTFYEHLEGTKPENHTLQYFRALFEMDFQEYFKNGMEKCDLDEIKPHTALSDVFVLWIFTAILMADFDYTLEDMVDLTNKPVLEDKFTYGAKNKTLDRTYEEIIYNDTVTPWGATQPGYDSIMWAFEDGPMSPDTEYSFITHMGKAILNGRIPFIRGKKYDYTQFLYLAIKYSFNEEEINQALLILAKEEDFIPTLLENMETKLKRENLKTMPEDLEEIKHAKWISKRENRNFLDNYTKMFRMEVLNKFS